LSPACGKHPRPGAAVRRGAPVAERGGSEAGNGVVLSRPFPPPQRLGGAAHYLLRAHIGKRNPKIVKCRRKAPRAALWLLLSPGWHLARKIVLDLRRPFG
jgi:hypothetical protein